MGWIIGIKNAEFFIDSLTPGSELITTVTIQSTFSDLYLIASGIIELGNNVIAEITLQAIKPKENIINQINRTGQTP